MKTRTIWLSQKIIDTYRKLIKALLKGIKALLTYIFHFYHYIWCNQKFFGWVLIDRIQLNLKIVPNESRFNLLKILFLHKCMNSQGF